MKISDFQKDEFEGEIVKVTEGVLADFKPVEVIEKWENADPTDPYLEVSIKYENTVIKQVFRIPKRQGYQRSNLKKFIDKNSFEKLDGTEDLVGKAAKLVVKKGYLDVAL